MKIRELASLYREAHNKMRNVDGLQPQEAFDELLKYLFFKQKFEVSTNLSGDLISVDQVRKLFYSYLGTANSWSSEIWREKVFYLSDECLEDIHKLLFPISLTDVSYDIRSHALREFLSSDLRKGHGIFLTPEEVVSAIVEFIKPDEKSRILDPACGSGTFLIETLNYFDLGTEKEFEVFGNDKSARMLLLADLNLGHFPTVKFKKMLSDVLKIDPFGRLFDLVLTNPPFGVTLDSRDYIFSNYRTCLDSSGYTLKKQSSEIVFIERCFQLLKPSGTLAIVIPKSIATNKTLSVSRKSLRVYGYIYGIMSLPPETFASTGTQTTTLVLFARKYKNAQEESENNKILFANIKNVGFDATGRYRKGSQLIEFPSAMQRAMNSGVSTQFVEVIDAGKKFNSFKVLENIFFNQFKSEGGVVLSEVCKYIGTGKTPARNAYSKQGTFLIKVGNLTGTGLNWKARDRNYIPEEEMNKRKTSLKPLVLEKGDILLTSSAHSPVYIAKKSDIYVGTPKFMQLKYVSFVGEVMLVRANPERICPYLLLSFLRSTYAIEIIQNMVRGQTAHLYAKDLGQLIVPREVFLQNSRYQQAAKLIEMQTKLNEKMNGLIFEQSQLLSNC